MGKRRSKLLLPIGSRSSSSAEQQDALKKLARRDVSELIKNFRWDVACRDILEPMRAVKLVPNRKRRLRVVKRMRLIT